MPVLEAMNLSKPLLLSDLKVHREVAGPAARYFSIAGESASEQLAESLREILSSPEKGAAMGEASRLQAKKYSWSLTAKKMAEVYEKIGATEGRSA